MMKVIFVVLLFGTLNSQATAQQLVDKNKGNHLEAKLGLWTAISSPRATIISAR